MAESLISPTEAMTVALVQSTRCLRALSSPHRTDEAMTTVAISQVYATIALVHAVRELTEEVRAMRARPHTPEDAEKEGAISVPDRIDYDDDGELDDVVVKDCDAHLERLDTGLWFLGLYGKDGRRLTIDIRSKTGRAAVTGIVKDREGIEETHEARGDDGTAPR